MIDFEQVKQRLQQAIREIFAAQEADLAKITALEEQVKNMDDSTHNNERIHVFEMIVWLSASVAARDEIIRKIRVAIEGDTCGASTH